MVGDPASIRQCQLAADVRSGAGATAGEDLREGSFIRRNCLAGSPTVNKGTEPQYRAI